MQKPKRTLKLDCQTGFRQDKEMLAAIVCNKGTQNPQNASSYESGTQRTDWVLPK